MKRNRMIAFAAILTFSLALAGCAVLPAAAPAQRGAAPETRRSDLDEPASAVTERVGAGYRGGNGTGAGYTDNCGPLNDGTTTADPDYALTEAEKTLSLSGYGSEGALDDASLSLADMLTYAIQDEYLARAEYGRITETFGSVRPFTNIMRAEETHIDSLLPVFEAYGITPPSDEGTSRAVTPSSPAEAYQAGVSAEVNNIAMYESFLDQDLPDNVRTVFESLMRASENHLRAFQNQR